LRAQKSPLLPCVPVLELPPADAPPLVAPPEFVLPVPPLFVVVEAPPVVVELPVEPVEPVEVLPVDPVLELEEDDEDVSGVVSSGVVGVVSSGVVAASPDVSALALAASPVGGTMSTADFGSGASSAPPPQPARAAARSTALSPRDSGARTASSVSRRAPSCGDRTSGTR
jgi:hypothetical protein